MSEHFVKHIKIEKYKGFTDFSAEGFKRVNLISGKNNIGKTALMEALLVSINVKNAQSIFNSLDFLNAIRSKIDRVDTPENALKSLKAVLDELKIETNINTIISSIDHSQILMNFEINLNGDNSEIPETAALDFLKSRTSFKMEAAYIGSVRDSQQAIINSFTAIQKKDRESDVNSAIHRFDDSIENIKVIGGDSIQCKVVDSAGSFAYRDLSEFGDGLRHYISVISDLFAVENQSIFIDEVDNGIHYSCLDQLWEIILTLSKELNVQVFATTHSKECIESYSRVAEKLKDEDISFITLVKNKEKVVKAIVRDYELLTNSMHDEREVRGR